MAAEAPPNNTIKTLNLFANPGDTAKLDRRKNRLSLNERRARFKTLCSCFLLIPLLEPTLLAQNREIKFERFGTEQGLSQNTVYCILQDRQGFMWFGTQAGLNRFDGYNCKVYKHEASDPNSLSNDVVRAIYEDRTGTLWIGTHGGGLNRFDREKETFKHYQHDLKDTSSISDNFVVSICEDSRAGRNRLWIGTLNDGLNSFEIATEKFKHLSHHQIRVVYEDRAGMLWIGSSSGLDRLDPQTGIFTHYDYDSQITFGLVWSILEDKFGMLWIGTAGAVTKFDRRKGAFTMYLHSRNDLASLSEGAVWSIFEDKLGRLWLGTTNGLDQFDRDNEKFFHLQLEPDDPNSVRDKYIRAVYEDRSGVLWLGTWSGGINKLDLTSRKFTHYRYTVNDDYRAGRNNIRAIYEDPNDNGNTLWLGTRGAGLNKFDRKQNSFALFANHPKSLGSTYIWSIFEDRAGLVWVGTFGDALKTVDWKNQRHTSYSPLPTDPNSLSGLNVTPIYEDRSGALWVGTDGTGLNRLDQTRKTFKHYKHAPNDSTSLSHNSVWSIGEDRSGVLWVGTSGGGLNEFDSKTETFKHYKNNPTNPWSLSNDFVMCIREDSFHAETLWIGTWGGGLNHFDTATGKFVHYTEKEGLPDNVINGLLQDDHGNLWLGTNKGLSRFNTTTKIFKNYDVNDGLQGLEFNFASYHKSRRTGEMFFGGANGFNAFHPDSIKDNPYIPPVVITSFRRYNVDENGGLPIEEKGISQKKEIELSYKDNLLAFEFAALSYSKTFKNQYAYKLEGYSEQWIQLGTERRVNFTNLDAGEYTLRVKGSNNDGVWNEEGASLKIIITPPWWKTWWAYALYAISALGLLIVGRRYELARARLRYQLQLEHEQAERLAEIDHMKSRFFANISHEFRTPLTLILGPLQKMLAENFAEPVKQQFSVMLRNAERLQRLINQLLDLAKLEAGKMKLLAQKVNAVEMTRILVMAFLSFAERKRIALKFEAQAEVIEAYIDRDKWEKIISNLVSNALKFTPDGGKVSVQLSVNSDPFQGKPLNTGDCLLLTVTDTGQGIPAELREKIFDRFYQVDHFNTREHEGTGIGLALTKELVELHHATITVVSVPGKGSTFIVRLPLGRAHLQESELALVADAENLAQRNEPAEIRSHAIEQEETSAKEEANMPEEAPLILIVEDNLDLCEYIRSHLQSKYRVIKAVDGEAGLEAALARIPDLIISDIMMPKMDGIELCKKIKTQELTSHIPVIMLTARAAREDKLAGLNTGADDYVLKPFDAEELQVRVKNLIAQRKKLRERFSREITLQPRDIAITTHDERFLQRALAIVEEHIADTEFDTEVFAQRMGTSRMQLHRKLTALTDQSTGDFIRTLRLKRAAQLLAQKGGTTIVEIAYEVGFSSPAHFAKCFREQFGLSPSEYVKSLAKESSSS